MGRLLAILLVLMVGSSCGGNKPPRPEWSDDPGLVRLMEWMEGDFDNTASLEDPGRKAIEEHFPIEVHLRRLPNIPNALYIEQAAMANPAKPYRQRVYILRKDGDVFVSAVHTLRDPAKFVNAHIHTDMLADIVPGEIDLKEGCDVALRWDGERYAGGTRGKGCATDLNGASYATAEIEIFDGRFSSWDRGFDANGAQVWGAEKLGYLFKRQSGEAAR